MKYIIDGSYLGLISAVFDAFERKQFDVTIVDEKYFQPDFFEVNHTVITDEHKYERVIKGLKQKLDKNQVTDFYRAYLSEDIQAWNDIFYIICKVFQIGKDALDNFGDEPIVRHALTLKKVSRERHRMKAFIRFSKSSDGLFFAMVEPDFNVLPLITSFFKNRYADQSWLIYDVKRNYGIQYDTKHVQEVQLQPAAKVQLQTDAATITLDEREALFQQLWQRYFKSTNIVARKNMKLHIQHVPKRYWKYLVPKRYWKYLVEKQ